MPVKAYSNERAILDVKKAQYDTFLKYFVIKTSPVEKAKQTPDFRALPVLLHESTTTSLHLVLVHEVLLFQV